MALSVGTPAPDFTVTTLGANGPELFKLSEHIGQTNILLLFVPMAFTGVCTKEFCEISNGINEYTALNAKVVGIIAKTLRKMSAEGHAAALALPLSPSVRALIGRAVAG